GPVMAAAAAMAGPMRWVLAFLPWRPSRLRFEVEAMRSPFIARSLFIDMQFEQPGSRHSNPASREIRSSPSSSAWCLPRPEPGLEEAPVEPSRLRLVLDEARARHDQRPHAVGHTSALGDRRRGAQILDA